MKCTLYLQDKNDVVAPSEIDFLTTQPNTGDIDEQNVVYEDGHYTGSLLLEDAPGNIESVELFLNGEILFGRSWLIGNRWYVRFEDEQGNETDQPFQLLYDLLYISVRVTVAATTENKAHIVSGFYSRYLASISKQPEDTQNAADMLKTLLNFENETVGDWMFQNEIKVENSQSSTFNFQLSTHQSPRQYVQLLEQIVICYQSNLQYFNTLARHSIKKQNVVRDYTKARVVSVAGFQWLMQNADQVVPVSQRTGIYHRGEYYIPRKILSLEPVSNRDVYENRIVLSFLMLVLKDAQGVKNMLGSDIEGREATLQKMQSTIRDGYEPPAISTIWQLPLQESKSFYAKIGVAVSLLETLYRTYNDVLKCKKISLKTFPRKTKTFQEVKPYSQVFEQMMRWFRFGGFDMKKNRIIFNLRTLDKLFEYFSLYKLLSMLSETGFTPIQDENAVSCYAYHVPDDLYVNETDVANTYHLENDDFRLTLYYQPVIHSDKFENGISVFRTTIPRRSLPSVYYTPDFLLKISKKTGYTAKQSVRTPVYIVLDSKYSNRQNILRRHGDSSQTNYLDKTVLKYSSQFSVLETREAPKMIWILQGRVDDGDVWTIHRFHNSPLARRFPPKSNYGIISVNTKSDTLHELWNEIRRLEEFNG